jgi:glycosyltransferase involved in cell wall biosynthesis
VRLALTEVTPVVERQEEPVVSVVMPVFQGREHLAAAIESVLTQTFEQFELLVVDDGSTDGTGDIARAYAERDPRVRYQRQENAGQGAARNAGIEAARGEAIAFLDHDDLWLPDKLARQMPLLGDTTVVYSDTYILREGGTGREERLSDHLSGKPPPVTVSSLIVGNSIPFLTTLVSRRLLLEHGGFAADRALQGVEDYDLWLRLATAEVTFTYVPAPLATYRVHSASMSADRVRIESARLALFQTRVAADYAGIYRKALRSQIRRERRVVARELWRRGSSMIARAGVAAGRPDLVRAVRVAPTWWRCWALAALLAAPPILQRVAIRAAARRLTEAVS